MSSHSSSSHNDPNNPATAESGALDSARPAPVPQNTGVIIRGSKDFIHCILSHPRYIDGRRSQKETNSLPITNTPIETIAIISRISRIVYRLEDLEKDKKVLNGGIGKKASADIADLEVEAAQLALKLPPITNDFIEQLKATKKTYETSFETQADEAVLDRYVFATNPDEASYEKQKLLIADAQDRRLGIRDINRKIALINSVIDGTCIPTDPLIKREQQINARLLDNDKKLVEKLEKSPFSSATSFTEFTKDILNFENNTLFSGKALSPANQVLALKVIKAYAAQIEWRTFNHFDRTLGGFEEHRLIIEGKKSGQFEAGQIPTGTITLLYEDDHGSINEKKFTPPRKDDYSNPPLFSWFVLTTPRDQVATKITTDYENDVIKFNNAVNTHNNIIKSGTPIPKKLETAKRPINYAVIPSPTVGGDIPGLRQNIKNNWWPGFFTYKDNSSRMLFLGTTAIGGLIAGGLGGFFSANGISSIITTILGAAASSVTITGLAAAGSFVKASIIQRDSDGEPVEGSGRISKLIGLFTGAAIGAAAGIPLMSISPLAPLVGAGVVGGATVIKQSGLIKDIPLIGRLPGLVAGLFMLAGGVKLVNDKYNAPIREAGANAVLQVKQSLWEQYMPPILGGGPSKPKVKTLTTEDWAKAKEAAKKNPALKTHIPDFEDSTPSPKNAPNVIKATPSPKDSTPAPSSGKVKIPEFSKVEPNSANSLAGKVANLLKVGPKSKVIIDRRIDTYTTLAPKPSMGDIAKIVTATKSSQDTPARA